MKTGDVVVVVVVVVRVGGDGSGRNAAKRLGQPLLTSLTSARRSFALVPLHVVDVKAMTATVREGERERG